MGKFKPLKELVRALTYIGDAIECKESEGNSVANDNTNYMIAIGGDYGFINKNLDSTKIVFDPKDARSLIPKKVGDIFTQEGVDIINSMLSYEFGEGETIKVFLFLKTTKINGLTPVVSLKFSNNTNEYVMTYGTNNIIGSTSDKFTLDTPMKNNRMQ